MARHAIKPERILGHGEVTPAYKMDPGPTFPWKRLSELGITPPWPDASRVAAARAGYETALPDAGWFQQALAKHGYVIERTGEFDAQTQRVLMNFQMRYRPDDYRGEADAETAPLDDPTHYRYDLDVPAIAEVWRRGSVISSWLLELTAAALHASPTLEGFHGQVSDSGEGRWTSIAAIDTGTPAPVLTAALFARFSSRGEADFGNRMLSAMRHQFGGHMEKVEPEP